MPSLNKVMLMGNLTRDPELRVTPKGTSICGFTIAVNREYKDQQGAKHDDTTFVDCEAWGKTGETIGKFFAKGRPIYVEGRLRLDQWEDKTTHEKRSRTKVVVEGFQFLGSKEGSKATGSAPAEAGQPSSSTSGSDEDVPF